MSYDIYGNTLKRGYCEVHPYVNESYPCSLCYKEIEDEYQRALDKMIAEHEIPDDWYIDNSKYIK